MSENKQHIGAETRYPWHDEDKPSEPILQFFKYDHLPEELQHVSQHFAAVANTIINDLPRNPERTVALRKLLEAKDAAVRAKIYK